MPKLQNKVALITGGNSGIGLASAKRFAQEGAKVVIVGRRQKELDNAVAEIGPHAFGIQGDVSSLKDLDRMISEVRERYHRIDILFANAGIGAFSSVMDATEAHFDAQFNINVKGLFFTVQKALPLMPEESAIILNASVAASVGNLNLSVYSATKAAVRSFARTWTQDLKEKKIRVNVISPGPISTPILSKMSLTQSQINLFSKKIMAEVPMGRFGTPEEVANAALFLASDESSYITGIELFVDGGVAQV